MMATSARGNSSFIFAQQLDAGEAGQLQIRDDQIGRAGFQGFERGFGGFGFGAEIAEPLAHGDAQAANALLVVHNQEAEFQFVGHGFPMVFSTASINC